MLNEATDILKEQTGIETTEKDWGSETLAMTQDELDFDIQTILKRSIAEPSKLISADMYLLINRQTESDYVVFFISDIDSENEFARGLLINGKLQWYSTGKDYD